MGVALCLTIYALHAPTAINIRDQRSPRLTPSLAKRQGSSTPASWLGTTIFESTLMARFPGKTPEGRATVHVLRLNEEERVEQRHDEMLLGNYPCQKNA